MRFEKVQRAERLHRVHPRSLYYVAERVPTAGGQRGDPVASREDRVVDSFVLASRHSTMIVNVQVCERLFTCLDQASKTSVLVFEIHVVRLVARIRQSQCFQLDGRYPVASAQGSKTAFKDGQGFELGRNFQDRLEDLGSLCSMHIECHEGWEVREELPDPLV
jgi:hypothetical protein